MLDLVAEDNTTARTLAGGAQKKLKEQHLQEVGLLPGAKKSRKKIAGWLQGKKRMGVGHRTVRGSSLKSPSMGSQREGTMWKSEKNMVEHKTGP